MPQASHPTTKARPPAERLAQGSSHTEPPVYVSLTFAADRLSLCDRTIRRAIANSELRAFKFGKALRVRLDDLDRWAETKAMPNARTVRKAGGLR